MTNKALFLDRDGIINVDHGYAYKPEQIDFVAGIFELCHLFQQRGYLILVVTNQSGIARGYYSEQDFLDLSDWMTQEFALRGITISEFFYCPHHPDKGQSAYVQACDCRKPKPGMLFNAIAKYELSPQQCIMIGDKESDMLAAQRAGLQQGHLVTKKTDIGKGLNITETSQQFIKHPDLHSVIKTVQ